MRATILSLLLIVLLAGCSNDDDTETLPFEGTWSLLQYTSGEHQESYQINEIIWEFNKYDELIVTINVELPDDTELPIQTDGVYEYVGVPEVLSLEGIQYAVSVEDNVLTLDHNSAAGGILIQLELISE